MRKNNCIRIAALAAMMLIAGDLAAITVPKSKQFTLRGGLNLFSRCGRESDYQPGENDFPVTPAFMASAAGIGLTFFTSSSFAIGFDVSYGARAKVDLRDPSDGETIRADTPQNLVAVFSLFQYLELSQRTRLFVSFGVGAEYCMAKEVEYVSDLGSRIIISAPANPISPLAVAGIGGQWMFSGTFGIGLECRAFCLFRNPLQFLTSPALTLVLKF